LSTFFDSQPQGANALLDAEELHARVSPPPGYEGCVVVQRGPHLVWQRRDALSDDDEIVFFDGDCRTVLTPDDARLATAT
jgi:hypothetical protein